MLVLETSKKIQGIFPRGFIAAPVGTPVRQTTRLTKEINN